MTENRRLGGGIYRIGSAVLKAMSECDRREWGSAGDSVASSGFCDSGFPVSSAHHFGECWGCCDPTEDGLHARVGFPFTFLK